MKRCDVVTMRRTLSIVKGFRDSGVEFVPIPVMSDDDRKRLYNELSEKIFQIENEIDATEDDHVPEPVVNMHEQEMIASIIAFYQGSTVEQIYKQKNRVCAIVVESDGSKRIEKITQFDPLPNCETARLVVS